ncbi:hypothetical protein AAFF_G00174660 [Aldrovandia affinis]|uniref:Uncharacterized protein n=1 Tax=Aldrovandia affinis TaxID=143900 RepID=A0AAD7RLJ8_9TELE|nr:hypothetical protein AAFF_G00174660 [Aldrovandia affinis]
MVLKMGTLNKLQLIQKEQNLHDLRTLVTPGQGLASHVEEAVQMAVIDPIQNRRTTERGTHAKTMAQMVSGPPKTGHRSKLILALHEKATRPVIGLRSVTECRLFNRPTFFLCAACSCRILKKDILDHIYNSLHRYKYIKSHHAHLLQGVPETAGCNKLARILNAIAKSVAMEEGMGVVQVIRLHPALYWKMFTRSPVEALNYLQMIQKQWNLKKDRTDQRRIIGLKHRPSSFIPEPTPKQPCLPNPPDALDQLQEGRIQGERVSVPGEARGGPSIEVKEMEPMVGLQLVIECRTVEQQPPPYCYLCQACSVKLTGDQRSINKHLSSPQHQYNYINSHRPDLLGAKKRTAGLHGTTHVLRTLAVELEKEEGSGKIQVIKLSACIYSEVAERNYQWCMKMLKCGESIGECQTSDDPGEINITQHAETKIPSGATKRCTPVISPQAHAPSVKKKRLDAPQSAKMGCKDPLKDLPVPRPHIVGRHAREHFQSDPSTTSYHIPPDSLCDGPAEPSKGPSHRMSHRLSPPTWLSRTPVAPSGPMFKVTLPLGKGQVFVERAPFSTQPSDPDWTLCPETPEVDLDPQFTSHNNGDLIPEPPIGQRSPLETLPPICPGPSQPYVDSQEVVSLCEWAEDRSTIVLLEPRRAPTSPTESHLPVPSQGKRECGDPAGRD